MSNKYQEYANLADSHAQEVIKDVDSWTKMLNTAARLYKYPFDEQLLIHAQKPDATACATINIWNKAMNRYVKKGTKGIALLDNVDGKQRLKYVFDIADTQDGRHGGARTPQLWQIKPEHEGYLAETLGRHLNADNNESRELNAQFFQGIARELVKSYIEEHDTDVLQSLDGNALYAFEETLINSTAYTIMARCGIDTAAFIESDVFKDISSFDTPKALKALGQGISEISENVLREIEATIKQYEREQQRTVDSPVLSEGRELDGRSNDNTRNNLSLGRGLSDTRYSDSQEGREPTLPDQIRDDAQVVLEGTEGDNLHGQGAVRGTVPPLLGEGGTSRGTLELHNDAVDRTEPTAGQGNQSNGMGSTYEYAERPSGRSDTDGTDIRFPIENQNNQANDQPSDGDTANTEGFFYSQPTLFDLPSEKEQIADINARAEAENAAKPVVITDEDIEAALISWNGDIVSKARIYEQLSTPETARAFDTAELLKQEYGNNRDLFSVTKRGAMPYEISWENVQFRLNAIIDEGRFLTPQDWAYVKEQAQTAQNQPPVLPESTAEPSTGEAATGTPKPTGLPLTKGIINAFRGQSDLMYAHGEDGSLYISNRYFIAKTAEQDIEVIAEQINRSRGRRGINVVPRETPSILKYIKNAQGNYELSQPPHVVTDGDGKSTRKGYVYADEKQYFMYNGHYVDTFQSAAGSEAQLFVNDNTSYELAAHNMLLKSPNNELLGLILPVQTTEQLYKNMADIMPLDVPYKSEYERTKENPNNDPYIGKEYTDGKDTYIVARLVDSRGEEMYLIPTVKDGTLSGGGSLVKPEDMEERISLWHSNRESNERYQAAAEAKAQLEAEAKAIYENTHGFADNLPPMQKGRVLTALDKSFSTKDYGNLSTKAFMEATIKEGRTLQAVSVLKKKHMDMNIDDYVRELQQSKEYQGFGNYSGENIPRVRQSVRNALESLDNPESDAANWLKENHPFLHYRIFGEENVLSNDYFQTEYRLMLDDNTFFPINKTAHDYGKYLIDNGIFAEQEQLSSHKLLSLYGKDYYLFHVPENADTPAVLSRDTLSLITEKADSYLICADVCSLSDEEMEQANIEFRKIPRDFGILPIGAQEELAKVRPNLADFGLRQQIREDLFERGFVASDELIDEGVSEYKSRNGRGNFEDITDFIEDEYLTEEPEPEIVNELGEQTAPAQSWDNFVSDTKQNATAYTEPFVVIEFSESPRFADFERLTFAEADLKFKGVEALELEERAEQGKYGGYHKTSGMIFYKADPADTELSTYEFRYDIGDYNGDRSGLYNHINNRCNRIDDALNGRNPQLANSVAAMGYTQDDVETIRSMLNICQPQAQERDEPLQAMPTVPPDIPAEQQTEESQAQPFPNLGKGSVLPENTANSQDESPINPPAWHTPDKNISYKEGDIISTRNISMEILRINEDDIFYRFTKDDSAMSRPLDATDIKSMERSRFETNLDGGTYLTITSDEIEIYVGHEPTAQTPTQEATEAPPQPFPNLGKGSDLPVNTESHGTNFRITDPHLGEGGAKTKYTFNVEAIRALQAIESENRQATPEEQATLSRYVGWGGIQEAFDERKPNWVKEYEELKSLLTPQEYEAARASTINAHYTSPTVITAMYETLERMGVDGGNILEPSCGAGNFFGLLPESMQNAKLYGVELDSITGRIAQQLYPQADIKVMGFEKTNMPDSFFDVAVGNVPFGNSGVIDKKYDRHKFLIHDYFFGKTLDQVRPGGIVAFVTSKGTLDKANPTVRKYLAQRADLLGAVRLPNNAFLKNAGTQVTSDIIFLQKREGLRDIEPDWVHLGHIPDGVDPDRNIPVNSYFAENPHMILGTMTTESGTRMYGNENSATCLPTPGADLSQQLKSALSHIQGQITSVEREVALDDVADMDETVIRSIPADSNVKNFSYALVTLTDTPDNITGELHAKKLGEGDVYYRENSRMHLVDMPKATLERVKGMVELRDITRELIDLQLYDANPEDIAAKQAQLNERYDKFTKKHGLINASANARAFNKDSSYYLLCSLEVLDDDGNLKRKSDMFSKRTIQQEQEITSAGTSVEALAVSIAKKARVDMPYMAQLTGFAEDKIVQDLQGIIFRDLGGGKDSMLELRRMDAHEHEGAKAFLESRPFVTADDYLSSNVREKLVFARDLVEKWNAEGWTDLSDQTVVNVQSLEKIQPKNLEAHEISVRLGSTWVDPEYFKQFMFETLQTPSNNQKVMDVKYSEYGKSGGEWRIEGKNTIPGTDVTATNTYGTSRINAYEILEATLNLRDVRVNDRKEVNGKVTYPINREATVAALEKQKVLKEAFKDWIYAEPSRRQALTAKYNELFNSTKVREFNGDHIEFAGASPEIELMPHQRGAIARILYGGNTLLAHEVGAGKTFEMVGAAMESKRLGLCNKSMMVVPNHLTLQTASEFLRLYPSANLLVATKKDFEPANRKKFCARIATGDYDAVIIGHSQFEKIALSPERQERLLREQIEEITDTIKSLKDEKGQRYTVKQMEKTKKSLEKRLSSMTDNSRKDSVIDFEQLGIDRLFVDEAHHYKNMLTITKMRNVAGISNSEAQKSMDMFMKCRYLDEKTGGKGIIMATGTPISNSMTEMFTLQRYLQYDKLQEKRLGSFDSWASTFGETVTEPELAPEGGYRARTRFAKFQNLPELMKLFCEFADIKTADTLDLKRPEAVFETVIAQPTEIQESLVESLSERATLVQQRHVKPDEDNFLRITTDGRKIGLDQRLIDSDFPDESGSKVNLCTENVFKIWEETTDKRSTQLVFCDASTPKSNIWLPFSLGEEQEELLRAMEAAVNREDISDDERKKLKKEHEPVTKKIKKEHREKVSKLKAGMSKDEIKAFEAAHITKTAQAYVDGKYPGQFNLYDDMKAKLILKGIPVDEIAFIHDCNTDSQKAALFAKVRSGKVRVLLGSTQKMGSGTNIQDKLIALHDLDCPWRPSDLEQRAGRIVRQGNQNPLVKIFRYVTESTFDAYLFQTVEKKQKFISQIMTSKSPVRACDDVDEASLNYAEIKALATGNPLIVEKSQLEMDISKLKILRGDYQTQIYRLQDNLTQRFPLQVESAKSAIASNLADLETVNANTHKGEDGISPMVINGNTYTNRAEAGEALIEARKGMMIGIEQKTVGSYRGFDVDISYDTRVMEYKLHLMGSTKHTVSMGDSAGNITRLDNALDKISENLKALEDRLENIHNQIDNANAALNKPFPQEAEYQEKMAKLAEIDAQLNVGNAPPEAEVVTALPATVNTPANATTEMLVASPREQTAPVAAKDSTKELFDRLNESDKSASKPTTRFPSRTVTPPAQLQPVKPTKTDDAR